MYNYVNGNASITLTENGTRVISYEGDLDLDYPLNIDIRVTNKCSLGKNPKTGSSFCGYCHESATTDGRDCDYSELKYKLSSLPKGIELAIGGNSITPELVDFLKWCYTQSYVCNLTLNQMHYNNYKSELDYIISEGYIKGLGLSVRDISKFNKLPEKIRLHPNTVAHVIMGLDSVECIKELEVNKILILGYKQFGRGKDYFNKSIEDNTKNWVWKIGSYMRSKHLSFDNLAIKQLQLSRYFVKKYWDKYYQGEESMYIDAVSKTYAPSSRSESKVCWEGKSIKTYFKSLKYIPRD